MNLKIFVCGHHDDFSCVPLRPFLERVNLKKLEIGEYQKNHIAETRIFLSNLFVDIPEYVGVVSINHNKKFCMLENEVITKIGQPTLPDFANLNRLELKPNLVHCAILSHNNCRSWFCSYFLGIEPFIADLEDHSGLSLNSFPSLMGNSFVCHRDVFYKFLEIWRPLFDYMWQKYPLWYLSRHIQGQADPRRSPGYLFEALSVLVWAKVLKENNLQIQHLSAKGREFKRLMVFKSSTNPQV